MQVVNFRKAYYIKLGQRGRWEENSINNNRMRFGWNGQSVADINSGQWDKISAQLRAEHSGKPQVATSDLNRLKDIAESTADDVWVTVESSTHSIVSPA